MKYDLLPHQFEAINAMNKCYNDSAESKSGIVSIPTGGGKTFTAVYWLNNILSKYKRKIVWLAQSFELLNQAYECMELNFSNNYAIKRVSSNGLHSNVPDISYSDNVIIITSQTAINSYKDNTNNFYLFIQNNIDNLVIVLDEAHHAPAFGFRKFIMSIKNESSNLWLLGLTATPTYTDKNRRGWLWEIFNNGIIYEVEKELLQRQQILAKENYVNRKTPHKITISEDEYNLLTKKHRDVPEHIIEEMASNQQRNDFIISEYISNKDFYGKTIIFLERWYQCEYFREKFSEADISCDAIYYQNSNKEHTNKQIIDEFKLSKFYVLLNVRMMTEGADVPNVKSVFITRETNSFVLLNQMIGRGLRGPRAGGEKTTANIVLFGDDWNKSIAWAKPEISGGLNENRIKHFNYPIQQISISLIQLLAKSFTFNLTFLPDYKDCIPCGWYDVEYVFYTFLEDEQIQLIKDVILVYNFNKESYDMLISFLSSNNYIFSEKWKSENISNTELLNESNELYQKFFNNNQPNSYEVIDNIIKIGRHIAQNGIEPIYISSELNTSMNMDRLVDKMLNMTAIEQYSYLKNEYSKTGSLWIELYTSFYYFKTAVDMYINKRLLNPTSCINSSNDFYCEIENKNESASFNEKEVNSLIKKRDGNKCLCCGLNNKETKLTVARIHNIPEVFSAVNFQTLCIRCNKNNTTGTNYGNPVTTLVGPNRIRFCSLDSKYIKKISMIKAAIRCTLNSIYDCSAIFSINLSRRKSSEFYTTCEVYLIKGNPDRWIIDLEDELINYIRTELGQQQVMSIKVKTVL